MKNAFIILASLWPIYPYSLASILPPNHLRIPPSEKFSGLAEHRYHAVIDQFESLYSPVLTALGAKLKIDRRWESPIVNAGTYRDEGGKHWHINLHGGFARHRYITEDGYTLVICHELGHHIGGAPKKLSIPAIDWSSNEGQADYFGTLKCLRKIFEADDNQAVIRDMKIPGKVSNACENSFSGKNEQAICIRTSMAGLAVANVMADSQGVALPSFEGRDTREVAFTMENHPRVQCRLDTYFEGSVCPVNHYDPVSQVNEVNGTCHPRRGFVQGNRPHCWFKPQ
jgi:hypothetical protein